MHWNKIYAKMFCCLVICVISWKKASGHPTLLLNDSIHTDTTNSMNTETSSSILQNPKPPENRTENETAGCSRQLKQDEYILLMNGEAIIYATNKSYKPTTYYLIGDKLCLRSGSKEYTVNTLIFDCKKWIYEPEEFTILENGSVMLYDKILEQNTYEINGEYLKTCADDYDGTDPHLDSRDLTHMILVYIGIAGTCISIVALSVHLAVFYFVPSLRNPSRCNLASMSVAFFIAYCFTLIGQIPEVLNTACVVSGGLVHYFLLAAFFWMNVMTFDFWRALRLATKKLMSTSTKINTRKFLFYSFYAWGLPMTFSIAAAIVERSDDVPERMKPGFGKGDMCWMTQDNAKMIFFFGPTFALFTINGIFFFVSAYIIKTNTMQDVSDHQRTARRNFTSLRTVRLGLIMEMTWLIGIISVPLNRPELWFVFNILNSLQGLFIFLLFPCSNEAWKQLKKIFRRGEEETKLIH